MQEQLPGILGFQNDSTNQWKTEKNWILFLLNRSAWTGRVTQTYNENFFRRVRYVQGIFKFMQGNLARPCVSLKSKVLWMEPSATCGKFKLPCKSGVGGGVQFTHKGVKYNVMDPSEYLWN